MLERTYALSPLVSRHVSRPRCVHFKEALQEVKIVKVKNEKNKMLSKRRRSRSTGNQG